MFALSLISSLNKSPQPSWNSEVLITVIHEVNLCLFYVSRLSLLHTLLSPPLSHKLNVSKRWCNNIHHYIEYPSFYWSKTRANVFATTLIRQIIATSLGNPCPSKLLGHMTRIILSLSLSHWGQLGSFGVGRMTIGNHIVALSPSVMV